MKGLFVFAAFVLLCFTHAEGQVYKKCSGETTEAFVNRIKPKQAKLLHFSEAKTGANGNTSVLYFYAEQAGKPQKAAEAEKQNMVGMLLTETRKNRYQQTLIDTIGGYKNAQIEAVFFVNADKDPDEEVAVLFSFDMDPLVSKCTGKAYETFFYKKPDPAKPTSKLTRVTAAGSFYGCDCTCMRNHQQTAEFKTRQAVIIELKRQGF